MKTIRILSLAYLWLASSALLHSQTLTKEYILFNDRPLAIEHALPPCSGALQVLGLSPPTGSPSGNLTAAIGVPQALEINYCNPAGGGATGQATLLVNEEFYGSRGCYFVYNAIYQMYFLMNDDATDWLVYSGAPLTNSYCTIANPSATVSKPNLTVRATLTWNAALAGSARVWSAITNNSYTASSGWTDMGAWIIPGNLPPTSATYSASGSRADMTLTYNVSDPNGYRNLYHSFLNITSSNAYPPQFNNACYLWFDQMSGNFRIANDAASNWIIPDANGVSSNSQCTLTPQSSAT